MYIRYIRLFLILLFPLNGIAKGIRFEQNLSWEQVKEKARAEHKFIFIDCYTTWCGPCRYMAREIFSKAAVGSFMNGRFLSVSMQMDSTAKDDAATRGHYTDAKNTMQQYQVESFPTYLFFDENGRLV